MQAGLQRFGTDFGNGETDRLFFPSDDRRAHYLAEKARILAAHPEQCSNAVESEAESRALGAAQAWLSATLAAEGHGDLSTLSLAELATQLSEDVVVVSLAGSGTDRAFWVNVCFPSGWAPEKIVGRSFLQIHGKIPAFEGVARSASSFLQAMVSRGPYVRFVWTISGDDELDHHPEHGRRRAWDHTTPRGFLRVERQVTVPLGSESASIFLIRTYLYGFDELTPTQRAELSVALRMMPPDIARYKRIDTALPRALELLR